MPNRETHPKEYAYCLLLMYLPFRNENELKYPTYYTGKLGAPGVIDIIKNNVDNAFERYNEDIQLNINSFAQLDNDEIEEEIGNEEQGVDLENELEQVSDRSSLNVDFGSTQIISDDVINNNIVEV